MLEKHKCSAYLTTAKGEFYNYSVLRSWWLDTCIPTGMLMITMIKLHRSCCIHYVSLKLTFVCAAGLTFFYAYAFSSTLNKNF